MKTSPMRTRFHNNKLIVFSLIILTVCTTATHFKSTDNGNDGKPQVLTGKLKKPKGNGPFPAVVLLHGSGGIEASRDADWAKRLTECGYVTLQVDSFGPRGVSVADILKNSSKVPHDIRAKDAHGARRYLTGLRYVNGNRITVMGWSHGGGSTIFSILSAYGDHPFKAAIAFYPFRSSFEIM